MAIQFPPNPTLDDPFTDGNGVDWICIDGTIGDAEWARVGGMVTPFNTNNGLLGVQTGTNRGILNFVSSTPTSNTSTYVESNSVKDIVILSQAEYDVLTPISTVLYLVTA